MQCKKMRHELCCRLFQLQQLVQSLQMQQQKPQPSLLQALDAGLVVQLQALTAQLTAAATANSLNPLEQRVSSFNKVMLESLSSYASVAAATRSGGIVILT